MHKLFQLGLALFIVSTVGCASDIMKIKMMVAMSGIVTDGYTAEPVNGVEIKLEENSILTNNDGYYKIDNIQSGEYKLIVNKNGYKKIIDNVNLSTKKVVDLKIYKSSSNSLPVATVAANPTANDTMASSTPSPIFTPTPDPTSTALMTTPDINAYATIRGKVVNDLLKSMDGAIITAKSLNSSKPYSSTVTSSNGNYLFTGVPTGVTIEIMATKPGYTTRTRTVVPLVNNQGGSAVNDMNFGQTSDGTQAITTALSNKPEISAITPNFNTSGVNPNTSFVIKFSEPMDTTSVEDNFIIRNRENYTFTLGQSFNGTHQIVYDKAHYDITWNTDKDELTASPKNSQYIPTDKDSSKVPSYYVSFSTPIKDAGGTLSRDLKSSRTSASDTGIEPADSLTDGPFRVTSVFKTGSPFSIATDTTAPKIEELTVNKTGITVKFNEPMALFPISALNPFYDPNLFKGATYLLKIDKNMNNNFDDAGETIGSPTLVNLDKNDTSNKTLSIPYDLNSYIGKSLWFGVNNDANLSDPAGNWIFFSNDKFKTSVIQP